MEITQAKSEQSQSASHMRINKNYFICQTITRILSLVSALTAIGLMVTSKQSAEVLGFKLYAKYNYSPAFSFFVVVHGVASMLHLLNSIYLHLPIQNSRKYFFLFTADFIVTLLAVAGCAAASAIGTLGKHGNSHTGWMPICDHFENFCDRAQTSIYFSCISILLFVLQTIWSTFVHTKV